MKLKPYVAATLALVSLGTIGVAWTANDSHSIGRAVKYLDHGVGTSIVTYLPGTTCSLPSGAPVNCVLVSATGDAAFNIKDALTIDVAADPNRATLCYSLRAQIIYHLKYFGTPRNARFYAQPLLSIESDVLRNASLINPRTGQPFNGVLETTIFAYHVIKPVSEQMPLEQVWDAETYDCITGISRDTLVKAYGLSPSVAQSVMAGRLKVRFGVNTAMNSVSYSLYQLVARLYSD